MQIQPLPQMDSLSDRAYNAIKNAIMSLQLRPGEFISIGGLATQLEVSRTPVRDSLLILEREGLVRLVPYKGAYVTEITPRDVAEIYDVRIALERYAARVAASRISAQDIAELEYKIEASALALAANEVVRASDLGRSIHDVILQNVDNRRLNQYLQDLDTQYTRFRRFSALIPGRLDRSHSQHKHILAALQAHDPDEAERAMTDHLTSVRDNILASIEVWISEIKNSRDLSDAPIEL